MKIEIFQDLNNNIEEKLKVSPFIHPTNSSYGFGGNIYNEEVYNSIFELKNRDISKPFFITVPDIDGIQAIGVYDNRIEEFILEYPDTVFTFIVQRSSQLPDYINPGISTVGVQIAQGPLRELFNIIDFPIFGTSANISGKSPIYFSDKILEAFQSQENIIFLDRGNLQEKAPSTIIDLTGKEHKILRGKLK